MDLNCTHHTAVQGSACDLKMHGRWHFSVASKPCTTYRTVIRMRLFPVQTHSWLVTPSRGSLSSLNSPRMEASKQVPVAQSENVSLSLSLTLSADIDTEPMNEWHAWIM